MKSYLMRKFALTEHGARGMMKAILLCFLSNLALMLPVYLIMATITSITNGMVSGGSIISHLPVFVLSSLSVIVLIWVIRYFEYAALYISVYKEGIVRRVGLAERLRKLPLSYFGRKDISDITTTLIADETVLEELNSHSIPQGIASVMSMCLIGVFMLIADWRMAISTLWVIPVAMIMTFGSRGIQLRLGSENKKNKLIVSEKIQEGIEHIRDIKSFKMKDRYIRELKEDVNRAINANIKGELGTGIFITGAQTILKLGLATTILTGTYLMQKGQINYTYFLGFILAATRIYDPFSQTLVNIAATFIAGLSIDRVRSIQTEQLQTGREEFSPVNYDIEFRNVSFAYQGDDTIIDGISFKAKQGEVTALVGPSGSGKSTVAKLAARFWDINDGKISLGGVDISEIDPEILLKSFSIVFQDVVLFNDTVMENIRLGRRGASDEEVMEAARLAMCSDFIEKMPEGYNTLIGENGSRLSGGERQRISIARALLKDAPVILLDEATASLDVESESLVQMALGELIKNKTVIVIAHRMRTVVSADHIVVLDKGKLVEEGKPDELMKRNGLFNHMVKLQTESAQWKI